MEGRMERPAKACGKKDGMMARFGHGASVGRFIITLSRLHRCYMYAPLLTTMPTIGVYDQLKLLDRPQAGWQAGRRRNRML